MGNEGIIDNCLFEDNLAHGVGGAIYIGGINNTISNSWFINSSSKLSGEAIYINRNRKNPTINNITTIGNLIPVIDGNESNIDVNYLYYSYFASVGILKMGGIIDMIPMIYKAISLGNARDEYHNYYYEYNNKSGYFAFNIYTDLRRGEREGLEYIQNIYV